jgi:hypothetical protein
MSDSYKNRVWQKPCVCNQLIEDERISAHVFG